MKCEPVGPKAKAAVWVVMFESQQMRDKCVRTKSSMVEVMLEQAGVKKAWHREQR